MYDSTHAIRLGLTVAVVAVIAFVAFAVFGEQRSSQRGELVTPAATIAATSTLPSYPLPAVTPVTTPALTPTQAPYPFPSLSAITPSPTFIIKLTPRSSVTGPPPCCTPQPPTLSASESLRQTLMRFPPEKRMIIDQDTIAVILIGKGDIHDARETRDRMITVVHHIPSLSVVSIDASNTVFSKNYKTAEGANHLEAILADPELMRQLNAFLIAYINKLPN